MTQNIVETARRKLLTAGLAEADSFKGCTAEEIESLEDLFSVRLPQCYRRFLATMGRAAGKFLVGSDYSYPKMIEFRKDAELLLRTHQADFELGPRAFVFMFHQGYTFLFFDCQDDSDDPPVFMFTEAEKTAREVFHSFSAWLLAAVEGDIVTYRELKKN